MSGHEDDVASEVGEDMFRRGAAGQASAAGVAQPSVGGGVGRGATAFVRAAPAAAGIGWGRGPVSVDARKFRYDLNAGLVKKPLPFSATKVDRLDAVVAGDLLHRIHVTFGIDREVEERILAFDRALWYEHAVNGGSTLQVERGVLRVESVEFDLGAVVKILGIDARRFFRAYADDISACLRDVIDRYSPYEPEAAEMYGAVMQVAVARGLQKYPYLIHDSSDAGVALSIEERMALVASKRMVIGSTVNAADAAVGRVGQSMAAGFAASPQTSD